MSYFKMILISLFSVFILVLLAVFIILRHRKTQNNPDYSPVLTVREKVVSLVSVILGVFFIAVGAFLPSFINQEKSDNNVVVEGSDEGNVISVQENNSDEVEIIAVD